MDIRELVNSIDVGDSFLNAGDLLRNKIDSLMDSELPRTLKKLCDMHLEKAAERLRDSFGYELMDAGEASESDIINSQMDIFEASNDTATTINFIAAMLCKQLDVGRTAGFEALRMWVFYKMKGNKPMEYFTFRQVAFHIIASHGDNLIPAAMGAKGGRPKNPRKKEAIEIAIEKWEQANYLSVAIVATAVKHQLEKKYTDAPSLPTIKKWITAAGIKPSI